LNIVTAGAPGHDGNTNNVIASTAKQSILTVSSDGLLRRFAPSRKRLRLSQAMTIV
jgi:hypothetical protein